MKVMYAETVERIERASEPLKDEPWDYERDRRELSLPGAACGVVSVHGNARDDDGTAFVSIELHALSCQQAEAVLRSLVVAKVAERMGTEPGRIDRVTYDIPAEEVGHGK